MKTGTLIHEDFRDDDADGGEIGSGHSVTALYEIKLHEDATGQMATVFIRHEDPDTHRVSETDEEIFTTELRDTFEEASPEFQLAATVAEFAEILRESFWAQEGSLEAVSQSLKGIAPQIPNASVDELMNLVSQANRFKALDSEEILGLTQVHYICWRGSSLASLYQCSVRPKFV